MHNKQGGYELSEGIVFNHERESLSSRHKRPASYSYNTHEGHAYLAVVWTLPSACASKAAAVATALSPARCP